MFDSTGFFIGAIIVGSIFVVVAAVLSTISNYNKCEKLGDGWTFNSSMYVCINKNDGSLRGI